MISEMVIMLAGLSMCDLSTPQLLYHGAISTDEAHESLNWISPDGDEVFFTRAEEGFLKAGLYSARRLQGEWLIEKLEISTGPFDADLTLPVIDGDAIFTSTRGSTENEAGGWDLWRTPAFHNETGWRFGSVEPLPEPINTPASECCAIYGHGDEFFFSSDREGDWNIYRATPSEQGYDISLLPGKANTDNGEWSNAILENRDLLFSSIREGGAGGDDIYVAHFDTGKWSQGVMLEPPVNTAYYEDNARIFGEQQYWSSRQGTETGDLKVSSIFYMPTVCVGVLAK